MPYTTTQAQAIVSASPQHAPPAPPESAIVYLSPGELAELGKDNPFFAALERALISPQYEVLVQALHEIDAIRTQHGLSPAQQAVFDRLRFYLRSRA